MTEFKIEEFERTNARQFFKGLRGKDRRNLTDVLRVLKDHDLDVVARGSSIESQNKDYGDIDLLVRGITGKRYGFVMSELGKALEVDVRTTIDPDKLHPTITYMDAITKARSWFEYDGTKFNVALSRYGEDIRFAPEQVDLVVNASTREFLSGVSEVQRNLGEGESMIVTDGKPMVYSMVKYPSILDVPYSLENLGLKKEF